MKKTLVVLFIVVMLVAITTTANAQCVIQNNVMYCPVVQTQYVQGMDGNVYCVQRTVYVPQQQVVVQQPQVVVVQQQPNYGPAIVGGIIGGVILDRLVVRGGGHRR